MRDTTKYPVGIQDFGEIIRGGYVYVDKTALLWRLIAGGKYYFLSRPRRFGKSLLLSTIAAYFSGRKELFEGLALAEQTREWPEEHPALYLDLSGQTYAGPESLTEILDNHLSAWERQYGADPTERSPARRFWGVIRRAFALRRRRVVILIDEYDKPLLDAAGDEALRERYRAVLQGMYGNLKTCDACIEFAMLTGVSKFSKVSIFSGVNNLDDISMNRKFSAICGMTEEELKEYFGDGIEALADEHDLSPEEVMARLKRQYDGYRFARKGESVYNPFSLLKALREGDFNDYWFSTGTPTFLLDMMRRENFDLEDLPNRPVEASYLDALDSLERDPLPILYQSGYLTIDHWDGELDAY